MNEDVDSAFANYLLRSKAMVSQFVIASRGVGDIQRQVYWPHLRSVVVPVPPLGDQLAIVCHIEDQTAELTRTGDIVRREVALLRELFTRLIADVVTGQLDVRDAAEVLPDEPEGVAPIEEDGDVNGDELDLADDTDADTEDTYA